MWRYWVILPGAAIALYTLRQVFQDIFHPSESGSISEFIARGLFRMSRRRPKFLPDAGPLAVALLIVTWALLVSIGFALVYWAVLPGNFQIKGGGNQMSFSSAFYFSLEVLTTLGLGDYAPLAAPLRFLVVFEALLGLTILTASVSSILLIDPALGRIRALARRTSLVFRTTEVPGAPGTEQVTAALLDSLAFDVARARVDLVHFPILYYFYSKEEHASLPNALLRLLKLANEASRDGAGGDLRRSAALLRLALEDLSELLARRFLNAPALDCSAILQAFAADHLISK
jgi:hypothetical protein